MVQAALMAAPYVLNALGGIFGKKKKYMDPETMKRLYGPQAIADETQQISNFILNSPYGQELLKNAATSGQNFQTEMASRAAQSGLDPSAGADSGASIFATGAATQAQNALEGQTKSGVWQSAMPIAAQNVAARAALAQNNMADQNAEPSMFQKIAAAAGGAVQPMRSGPTPNAVAPAPVANTAALRAPGEEGDNPSQTMVGARPNTRRRPMFQ